MAKFIFLVALIILLAGCASPNCPTCPLVSCEKAPQPLCPVTNCTQQDNTFAKCPKITIIQNVTYTKYVCPNGLVLTSPDECFPVLDTNLTPVMTNENNTYIQAVTVEPGCSYGINGGTVKFAVGTIAGNITYQVKQESNQDYVDVDHMSNLYSGSKVFVISDRLGNADFRLDRNKVYLLRVKFYFPALNKTQYSNEHLVDTRTGSMFTVKKCSG